MISDKDILSLEKAVDKYWTDVLSTEEGNRTFYNIATGKEGGHQLSDRVDQLSTEFISTTYPLRSGYQKSKGKISSRSMGDIWFKNEQDEWNPINVKTGLMGSEGQPNIVSLKRVMTSIMDHTMDSYYILLVKFQVDPVAKKISHSVHLTDILNWLSLPDDDSVVTFDSGPGQTMLKAKHFFDLLSNGVKPKKLTVWKKMDLLMDLYRDGERRLRENRARDLRKFELCYKRFALVGDNAVFTIDKEKQRKFGIEL